MVGRQNLESFYRATQKDRVCFHAKYVDDGMGM